MPNDFLPVVGNQMGDWLCLRFGEDSCVRDIVHWYHGGGDWIPWGTSLSEALLFDAFRERLPGSGRDHAVPAPSLNQQPGCSAPSQSKSLLSPTRLQHWATEQLHEKLTSDPWMLNGSELTETLMNSRISQVAINCQLIIDSLGLSKDAHPSQLETVTGNPQPLRFDQSLPAEETGRAHINGDQNWERAFQLAQETTMVSSDVAWAWEVIGYANERGNRLEEAFNAYEQGLECSSFSDQSVRLRTHLMTEEGQKFSAARLILHGMKPRVEAKAAYLDCLNVTSASERRTRVCEHFTKLADASGGDGAYGHLHRAGWDLGAEPLSVYGELLERLSAAANESGRHALAALSETHLACFQSRYGG